MSRQAIVEQGENVRPTGSQRQYFSLALAQIGSQRQNIQVRCGTNAQPVQSVEIRK